VRGDCEGDGGTGNGGESVVGTGAGGVRTAAAKAAKLSTSLRHN
jgi:hypothetical protein